MPVITDNLMDLLNHCQANGRLYHQAISMPTGSPVRGLIAEAVLQRLEAIVIQTFIPQLWKRYVGDTFAMIDVDWLSYFHMALKNVLPGMRIRKRTAAYFF